MPYNFFALLKENDQLWVERIALGNALQGELSEMFAAQRDDLINENVEVIPFDGQYKPELDEVLAIGGFELPDMFKIAIDSPMTLAPLHFTQEANGKIIAIFCGSNVEGSYKVLLQLFEGARLIKPNMMNIIFNTNDEFQKLEYFGMTLDSRLTAYFDHNQLHFKSYHFTRRIFDLSAYYREATNQEVMALAGHDHFAEIDNDAILEMADHVVRQTIARIHRNNVLNDFTVNELATKAGEINLELQFDDNQRIVLPNEKKPLKILLSFLDDQVFLGPISGQTRVSNSSKVIAPT